MEKKSSWFFTPMCRGWFEKMLSEAQPRTKNWKRILSFCHLRFTIKRMKGLSLKLLRYVSLAEGISFLVLLYAAIYQKRILGDEKAIAVPGMIHGVLFVIFCFCLLHVWIERGWSIKKVAVVFICSLLPFAPFYLERKLKQEELSSSGEG